MIVGLVLGLLIVVKCRENGNEAFVTGSFTNAVDRGISRRVGSTAANRDAYTVRKSSAKSLSYEEANGKDVVYWHDRVVRLESELNEVREKTRVVEQARISARTSFAGVRGAHELASAELSSLDRSVSELEATLRATLSEVGETENRIATLKRQQAVLASREISAKEDTKQWKLLAESTKLKNQALKARIQPAAQDVVAVQRRAAQARRDVIGLRALLERHQARSEIVLQRLATQVKRWWHQAIHPPEPPSEYYTHTFLIQLMAAGAYGEALALRDQATAQAAAQAAAEAKNAGQAQLRLEQRLTDFVQSAKHAMTKVVKSESAALRLSARKALNKRAQRKEDMRKYIQYNTMQKKSKSHQLASEPLVPAALVAIVSPQAAAIGLFTAACAAVVSRFWPSDMMNLPPQFLSFSTARSMPPKAAIILPTPNTETGGVPPPPPPPYVPGGSGGSGGGDGYYGNSPSDWRVLPPARHTPLEIGSPPDRKKQSVSYPRGQRPSLQNFEDFWQRIHMENDPLRFNKKKKYAHGEGLTQGMWAKAIATVASLASVTTPLDSFAVVDCGAQYADPTAAVATMRRHDVRLALVRGGNGSRHRKGRRQLEPLFYFEQNITRPIVVVDQPQDVVQCADQDLAVVLTGRRVEDFPDALLEAPRALILDLPGIPTANWSFVLDLGTYFQHAHFTLPTAAFLDTQTAKLAKKIGPDRLLWASAPTVSLDDEPRYARNLFAAAKRIDALFPNNPGAQSKILGRNAFSLFPAHLLGGA